MLGNVILTTGFPSKLDGMREGGMKKSTERDWQKEVVNKRIKIKVDVARQNGKVEMLVRTK